MLPFGSITSIIPLFVLAFAYLLFFSASALSKTKTDGIDLKPPSHNVEIGSIDIQFNTVDFRDISIDADAAVPDRQIFIFPIRTELSPPGIPVRRFLPPFCGSRFSPRPPPSLFLQV